MDAVMREYLWCCQQLRMVNLKYFKTVSVPEDYFGICYRIRRSVLILIKTLSPVWSSGK